VDLFNGACGFARNVERRIRIDDVIEFHWCAHSAERSAERVSVAASISVALQEEGWGGGAKQDFGLGFVGLVLGMEWEAEEKKPICVETIGNESGGCAGSEADAPNDEACRLGSRVAAKDIKGDSEGSF
jgi:hypothetical protein